MIRTRLILVALAGGVIAVALTLPFTDLGERLIQRAMDNACHAQC